MANDIKYPRVIVSKSRHAKLSKEARARKTSIEEVAEEKFKQAEAK
jgi:hypothetical protein